MTRAISEILTANKQPMFSPLPWQGSQGSGSDVTQGPSAGSFNTGLQVFISLGPSDATDARVFAVPPRVQVLNVQGLPIIPLSAITIMLSVASGSTVGTLSGTTVKLSSTTTLGTTFGDVVFDSSVVTAGIVIQASSPGLFSHSANAVSITSLPPAGAWGSVYTNLATIFNDANVWHNVPSQPDINPMDLTIPTSAGGNAYGLRAFVLPWDAVTDGERGTVTQFLMPSGTISPPSFSGPSSFTGAVEIPIAVTSLTRGTYGGGTALFTCVTATAHGLASGDIVRMAGAGSAAYNGLKYVTVVDATTFTWNDNNQPTTPAGGTITAARANLPGQIGIGFHIKIVEWGTGNAKHMFPLSQIASQGLPGLAPNHYFSLFVGSQMSYGPCTRLQNGGGFANFDISQTSAKTWNTWVKTEIYWKANTPGLPDGLIKCWLNGELIQSITTCKFFATGQNLGFTGLYHNVTDGNIPLVGNSRYYEDDLIVCVAT